MFTLRTKGLKEKVTLTNLPTLRQAFVVAAVLIMLGYVLGYYVAEIFYLLPLVVAGGLLFSGAVGFCPMVHLLQLLPENRPTASEAPEKK